MGALSRLECQYDSFLFASVSETDEPTLSVLSVLARLDVDPWQEAARLAQLSRDQAVDSLASKIGESDDRRWSAVEATRLAARLVELLPSLDRPGSNPLSAHDGNARASFWIVAWILFMSVVISGNSMHKSTRDSAGPIHGVSMAAEEGSTIRSSGGTGTD